MLYYMIVFDRNTDLAAQANTDYSVKNTLIDLAISIHGVSSGLLVFLVFGTIAPCRGEDNSWLQPCGRRCQGCDGLIPLDSIDAFNRRTFDAGDLPSSMDLIGGAPS